MDSINMADDPTNLDTRRGMAAQKATELRRLRSEVEADQAALRARQAELEDMLAAAPATAWPEAVEKVRYLLGILAQSSEATDPRRRKLIDRAMADLDHLLDSPAPTSTGSHPGHHTAETDMAKGEQRGNREAKKPKKEKPKAPEAASPFANAGKSGGSGKPPGGKQ